MSPRTAILVFGMAGCDACAEYIPRFRARSRRFAGHVPIHVLDANQHTRMADYYRIRNTPTTLVLRKPQGVMRVEGAVGDAEIERILAVAYAYR